MPISLYLDAAMKQLYIQGRQANDKTMVPNGDRIEIANLGDGVDRFVLVRERDEERTDETTGEVTQVHITYRDEITQLSVEIRPNQVVRVDCRTMVPLFACGMFIGGTYSNGVVPPPEVPVEPEGNSSPVAENSELTVQEVTD